MLEALKKQLLNTRMTPEWAVNTGALRQIGKTTALMQLADEFTKHNDSPMVAIGACPCAEVYVVVPNQFQKKRLGKFTKYVLCTDSELEGYLSCHSRMKVVLFDEGCNLEKLKRIKKDTYHSFAFFAGWINEQQVSQYQQLNALPY